MEHIKFSIGVPAFKSKFLTECISSILVQTYRNFELIIINDFSPHPVEEVVFKFDDERIRYYKNEENVGSENVVHNWNKCLEKATGDFFILMGDDDKLEPDFLEEFLVLINKYKNLDVFHCRAKIIDENSSAFLLSPMCPEFESVYDNIWHRINGHRRQYISDFVYRTNVLKENGGFFNLPLAWGSDDISAYIACGEKGIAYTKKPVFNYRRSSQTISNTGSCYLKIKAIELQKEWFLNFLDTVPNDQNDQIIYNDLHKTLNKYIQKKKIETIAVSLETISLMKILDLQKNRKSYNLSFLEMIFSILEGFKIRKASRMYSVNY